jgi:DNA processing protein
MEYPESLKKVNKPPFVLFYKGNLDLLQNTKRVYPISALELNEEQVKDVQSKLNSKEVTVTTGYSSIYERDIVENFFEDTIIVKDGGIDNTLIITKELEDKHLLKGNLILSEYPGFNIPSKDK